MAARQATCVSIGGRGLLIEGPPGSGKSSLALALIDRGAILVGDDGVMLEVRDNGLIARPHPETSGLLEIRNLGIMRMPTCEESSVAMIIRLDKEAPRYIDSAGQQEIEGKGLPLICLWPDSPVLALKAEMALDRFGLELD
ncbi:MAG: HPr kinase/phosphatase C-terminal domain-containing protein [Novosphingobium sp.]|nr:HPr kinase/phosphatase C-terminal domain-containing protein [Novosphingobium sp.]